MTIDLTYLRKMADVEQPDPPAFIELIDAYAALTTPRPASEYHEDMGDVMWWCWEPPKPFERINDSVVDSGHNGRWLGEPPYVGRPNDLGLTVQIEHSLIIRTHANPEGFEHEGMITRNIGGWPGYHTHWTPLPPTPKAP